jgi:excinuclease UvrABC ATPase subunit
MKYLAAKLREKHSDMRCAASRELLDFIESISSKHHDTILSELSNKLNNQVTIGLQYLTLDRTTGTLSAANHSVIKMVRHLGSSIEDLLYIFDEPSIGLHPHDLENFTRILQKIKTREIPS